MGPLAFYSPETAVVALAPPELPRSSAAHDIISRAARQLFVTCRLHPEVDLLCHLCYITFDMAQGPSGRVVIEMEPTLKRDLHSVLAAVCLD